MSKSVVRDTICKYVIGNANESKSSALASITDERLWQLLDLLINEDGYHLPNQIPSTVIGNNTYHSSSTEAFKVACSFFGPINDKEPWIIINDGLLLIRLCLSDYIVSLCNFDKYFISGDFVNQSKTFKGSTQISRFNWIEKFVSMVISITDDLYSSEASQVDIKSILERMGVLAVCLGRKISDCSIDEVVGVSFDIYHSRANAQGLIRHLLLHCANSLRPALGRYGRNVKEGLGLPFLLHLRILGAILTPQVLPEVMQIECEENLTSIMTEGFHITVQSTVIECSRELLSEVYLALELLDPSGRREVACRVLSPLLQRCSPRAITTTNNSVSFIEEFAQYFQDEANKLKDDLETQLLLLCLQLTQAGKNFPVLSCRSEAAAKMWESVRLGLLHTNSILRKRAMFVVQTMMKCQFQSQSDAQIAIRNSFSEENDWILQNKARRDSWIDMIEVISQAEGCNSPHLLNQVLPNLERLFKYVALLNNLLLGDCEDSISYSEARAGETICFKTECENRLIYIPEMNLSWAKAAFHTILSAPNPGVRRCGLHRLLSGRLMLTLNYDTINFLFNDVLSAQADTVSYFSAYFLDASVDIGCSAAIEEVRSNKRDAGIIGGRDRHGKYSVAHKILNLTTRGVDPEQSPGILMPCFISGLVAACVKYDNQVIVTCKQNERKVAITSYLLREVIKCVCGRDSSECTTSGPSSTGLRSLTAAKWLLRAFAETTVLTVLPRCLNDLDLKRAISFIAGRLASSNGLVRGQVLMGLIPLLLRCSIVNPVEQDVCNSGPFSQNLLALTDLSANHLGLAGGTILDSRPNLTVTLLTEAILESQRKISKGIAFFSVNTVEDMRLLAFASVLVKHSPRSAHAGDIKGDEDELVDDTLTVVGDEALSDAQQLYSRPYMTSRRALGAIYWLQGTCQSTLLARRIPTLMAYISPVVSDRSINFESVLDITSYVSSAVINSTLSASFSTLSPPAGLNTAQLRAYLDVLVGLEFGLQSDSARKISEVSSLIRKLTCGLNAAQSVKSGLMFFVADMLTCLVAKWCEASFNMIASISADIEKDLKECLTQLCESLIRIDAQSTQEEFQACCSLAETGKESTLITDYVLNLCRGQYSRASNMATTNRWSAIRSIFSIYPLSPLSSASSLHSSLSISMKVRLEEILLPQLLSQMETCSISSLPSLLSCVKSALRSYLSSVDTGLTTLSAAPISASGGLDLEAILAACHRAVESTSEKTDATAQAGFIALVFDEQILAHADPTLLQAHFDRLMSLAERTRPHLISALALRLCSAWTAEPLLLLKMPLALRALLLCKEPPLDDNNVANPSSDGMALCPARILVLKALETIVIQRKDSTDAVNNLIYSGLQLLIEELLNMNLQPEYTAPAMIGTDVSNEKLRCWQALCVLAPLVDKEFVKTIYTTYFIVLGHNCVNSIRVHMEVFGAALCRKWPSVMIPQVLRELDDANHTQQKLASIFVLLGHVYLDAESERDPDVDFRSDYASEGRRINSEASVLRDPTLLREICRRLVSWMGCSNGLPRNIAQLVVHSLIPTFISVSPSTIKNSNIDVNVLDGSDSNGTEQVCAQGIANASSSSQPSSNVKGKESYGEDLMFLRVYTHLSKNKDSVKILKRQREFFATYTLNTRCSVRGLLELQKRESDNTGEIFPAHLLVIIEQFLKAETAASLAIDTQSLQITQCQPNLIDSHNGQSTSSIIANNSTTNIRTDIKFGRDATLDVVFERCQIKRLPFDELQLAVAEHSLNRSRNAAGRRKQELIVCASLVDKAVNLAGLARTCEIFAVRQLIVPNLIITKSEAFQGIAVSADLWLDLYPIAESELLSYLRNMKKKGYFIIALEQTDSSRSLADPADFPTRAVLLLGREKEGVPADFLAEVDLCVEIPQYGVTRSLNVHVSAALFIWEMTRRNRSLHDPTL